MNRRLAVFLAAALGDLFTYCITRPFQLAIAHNADTTMGGAFAKFLAVFAPTQIPLAVIEGILTVLIMASLGDLCETGTAGGRLLKGGTLI